LRDLSDWLTDTFGDGSVSRLASSL